MLRPGFRFYRQSAADFYRLTLNGTPIDPTAHVNGAAPFYSADYRLARLETTTVGLKLVVRLGAHFSADLTGEHYVMRGRDGVTPQSAFPSARIVTAGITCRF